MLDYYDNSISWYCKLVEKYAGSKKTKVPPVSLNQSPLFLYFWPLNFPFCPQINVTKHHTGRTGAKYRSWVLVKCVWCGAYY